MSSEFSGSPVRSSSSRSTTPVPNAPTLTEEPSNFDDDFAVHVRFDRGAIDEPGETGGAATRPTDRVPEARKPGPSIVGMDRIKLVFFEWPIDQSELHRNVVEAAGREAAIEMSQSRNDDPDDRSLNVRPRLIENEEIEAVALDEANAGGHLLVGREMAKFYIEIRSDRRSIARYRNGWSARRNGMMPSRLDFSPVPPPIRPSERN